MGLNLASGFNFDTGSGTNHVHLIASIGGQALVHDIRIQGFANIVIANITNTAGNFSSFNRVAGVQYGAVGHVPTGITDGAGTGENWIVFAAGLPKFQDDQYLPGASPQNAVQNLGAPIDLHWSGLFFVPSTGYDLHFELGTQNTHPTSNFELDYAWAVQYST